MVEHNNYYQALYVGNGCYGHRCPHGIGGVYSKAFASSLAKHGRKPITTKRNREAYLGHDMLFSCGNRWDMLHYTYDTGSFECWAARACYQRINLNDIQLGQRFVRKS